MENYAYTDETRASEVASNFAYELRRIVNDSDDATVEDVLDRLDGLATNYELLATGYAADEKDAENKRWAQCEIDIAEGRTDEWADLETVIQRAFQYEGPREERCCPWRRTLAEPWRSIAEAIPLPA